MTDLYPVIDPDIFRGEGYFDAEVKCRKPMKFHLMDKNKVLYDGMWYGNEKVIVQDISRGWYAVHAVLTEFGYKQPAPTYDPPTAKYHVHKKYLNNLVPRLHNAQEA